MSRGVWRAPACTLLKTRETVGEGRGVWKNKCFIFKVVDPVLCGCVVWMVGVSHAPGGLFLERALINSLPQVVCTQPSP
jgi:hypothetical protein